MNDIQHIGFGGGCHWCTEAVFQSLKGVIEVRQGFIRSEPPHDDWSEAVEVDFDPAVITPEALLSVHLATHASSSLHKFRKKYRSAVYIHSDAQRQEMEHALTTLQQQTDAQFITQILVHHDFKPSESRYQNYYATDAERPFCQNYIDPKLAKLRAKFSTLLKDTTATEPQSHD